MTPRNAPSARSGSTSIAVVGAGVIGLTSALRLHRAGYSPAIFARELPADSTSSVAAAFWYPYKVAVDERALGFALATLEEYQRQIAAEVPGLVYRELTELFSGPAVAQSWMQKFADYRLLEASTIARGLRDLTRNDSENRHVDGADSCGPRFDGGHCFSVPLADTSLYVPWLEAEVRAAGIPIEQRELKTLLEIDRRFPVIVNCSGLGARTLADDAAIYPIRGQVQLTEPLQPAHGDACGRILLAQGSVHSTYIVPRINDCLLGGTAEENDWNTEPDPLTAKDIRARCELLLPDVGSLAALRDRAGLRPARKTIRLESEQSPDGRNIIHNYGHGGAGFTTCWGCADEVVRLLSHLEEALRRAPDYESKSGNPK